MIAFQIMNRSVHTASVISKMTNLIEIKTFVFLDIETTGLPQLENNRTKITELSMVAVQADRIRLGVFPRVQNKLNFCFHPWKLISPDTEKMTGLSNHLLEHQSRFSAETVNTINSFLSHNSKPICFVAHNGDYFDYPILRAEIDKVGSSLLDDIICIDSLTVFRNICNEEPKSELKCEINDDSSTPVEFTDQYDALLCDAIDEVDNQLSQKLLNAKTLNETTPKKQIMAASSSTLPPKKKVKFVPSKKVNFSSFKLSDIYTRLTKKSPVNQHQAESDALMLIMCAATLGDKFVNWANANTKKFCDIPQMVPGKKIGS